MRCQLVQIAIVAIGVRTLQNWIVCPVLVVYWDPRPLVEYDIVDSRDCETLANACLRVFEDTVPFISLVLSRTRMISYATSTLLLKELSCAVPVQAFWVCFFFQVQVFHRVKRSL